MAANEEERGRASGHSVEEDSEGGFRWSAFGPSGRRDGRSQSREDAEAAAHAAERELSQDLRSGA